MIRQQRNLSAARSATVRISDGAGGHRGQGLLLNLGDEGSFVLTCHHIVAPLGPGGIYVSTKATPGQSEVRTRCRYDAQRSRPSMDAAVLRVPDLRPENNPLLHAVDSGEYDGSIDVFGLTYMQPNSFNARLGPRTSLDLPVPVAGEFPDPPSRYQIDNAFRLVAPSEVREGISGGVVYSPDGAGVMGLIHFSRPQGTDLEPEGYLVPLEVWAQGWPALGRLIEPFVEDALRQTAIIKRVRSVEVGESGDIHIEGYRADVYVTPPVEPEAREALDRYDKVFIIGSPTSGKTRLVWEIIREQEEAILVIPTYKEPPANLRLPGLSNQSVILLVDDLHRKWEFDVEAWYRRLSVRVQDCRLICITRDARDYENVKSKHHLGLLLESTDRKAFVYTRVYPSRSKGKKGDDFGSKLATKLGLEDVNWRESYDGTPGSLIRQLQERKKFQPLPKAAVNTLPPRPLNITGRDDEIKKLKTNLLEKNVRLLTVWGSSGGGKTVLSILAAAEVQREFTDGVCFVDLSKVSDPSLVASEIGRTLKLKESQDSSLISFLENKHLLLVLDNFEHVITQAVLVQNILLACRKLKILVTSQYRLSDHWVELRRWEQSFRLNPFDVEGLDTLRDLDAVKRHPAVALFETYARVAAGNDDEFALSDEEFRLTAKICATLDGLPLAIEVVASQTDSYDIADLYAELKEDTGWRRMDTQGRLEKAFSLSYERLDGKEQDLYRRVAVFTGGWTRELLEGLYIEMGISYEDMMTNLTSIIRKSLVYVERQPGGTPRYKMLQPLLIYARSRWSEAEAQALPAAHAAYLLKLVKEAEPYLVSANRDFWLGKLEAEHSNLQAALDWCLIENMNPVTGREIAGRLFWFWNLRGYFTEGRRWLTVALQKTDEPGDSLAWARALYADGGLAFLKGEYEEARPKLVDSMSMLRDLDEKGLLGYALIILGMVEANLNNLKEARRHEQESVGIFRGLDDQWGLALALNDLGNIVVAEGRALALSPGADRQSPQGFYDEGRGYYEEALEIWRRLNDYWGLQLTLIQLGTLAYEEQEYTKARQYYEEALQFLELSDDKWGRAAVLRGLGSVDVAKPDLERATQEYYESFVLHWQLGRYQLIVECVEGIALIAVKLGQAESASSFLGAAEKMRDDFRLWDIPGHRESFNQKAANLLSSMNAETFKKTWTVGRNWKPDQVFKAVTDFVRKTFPVR